MKTSSANIDPFVFSASSSHGRFHEATRPPTLQRNEHRSTAARSSRTWTGAKLVEGDGPPEKVEDATRNKGHRYERSKDATRSFLARAECSAVLRKWRDHVQEVEMVSFLFLVVMPFAPSSFLLLEKG